MTCRQLKAKLAEMSDDRWEVREGPALRGGGGYYFRGPVREDGLCFEGALAVGKCAACASEYSLTGPFCVGCAEHLRGVRLSKSKVPNAGFGLFTSTSFAKGAPICEYLGERIDDWTLGRRYDGKASPYALRYGRSSIYVDALGQRSLGSTANNSRHPNAEYTVLASAEAIQDAAGGRRIEHATPGLWLTALVAIASNREVFTAYVDGNDDDHSTDVDWWGADDDVDYEVPRNATWTTWKAVLPRGMSAPSLLSPLNDAARASVDGEYAPPTGNPRTAREDLKKHVLLAAARDKSSTVFARHSW